MVYHTDLPKYILNERLVATRNTTYGAGMIIIPALGLGGARPAAEPHYRRRSRSS